MRPGHCTPGPERGTIWVVVRGWYSVDGIGSRGRDGAGACTAGQGRDAMEGRSATGRGWRGRASGVWRGRRWQRPLAVVVLAYLLITLVLGVYWSREPGPLELVESRVTGQVMTTALAEAVATLRARPGGHRSSARTPARRGRAQRP